MDSEELIKINERLDNIEGGIALIFEELRRKTPDHEYSFALYASTYFTAQQVREINVLFGQATIDQGNGKFKMTEFREQFEAFRQRHLPRSCSYSLRLIAEGFLVEGKTVALCRQILDDIEMHPEKQPDNPWQRGSQDGMK